MRAATLCALVTLAVVASACVAPPTMTPEAPSPTATALATATPTAMPTATPRSAHCYAAATSHRPLSSARPSPTAAGQCRHSGLGRRRLQRQRRGRVGLGRAGR